MNTTRKTNRTFGTLVGPLVLLSIGSALLAGRIIPGADAYVPAAIGAVLVIGFAITRDYALAIAGGTLSGIGAGIVMAAGAGDTALAGGGFMLGLGSGLGAVWILGLVARPVERHPWPLVTGGIVSALGFAIAIEEPAVFDMAGIAGAGVVLAIGLVLLVRGARSEAVR